MDNISLIKKDRKQIDRRFKARNKNIKGKCVSKNNHEKTKKKIHWRKPLKKARATIYLGHIPHGFYENEMLSYFSQFGKVLSARVARSKKTGRSRGFGFVEFHDEEVAQIAAETMNNYLMFNRILKCRYIPPEERVTHFTNINQFNYPKKLNRIKAIQKKNSSAEKMNQDIYRMKAQQKIEQFKKFFEDKGIDFSLKFSDSITKKHNKNDSTPSNETGNKSDDQYRILEIDESDNDIHFTTPPNVRKVIRKSCDSGMLKKQSKKLKIPKADGKKLDMNQSVQKKGLKRKSDNDGKRESKQMKISQKINQTTETVKKVINKKMKAVSSPTEKSKPKIKKSPINKKKKVSNEKSLNKKLDKITETAKENKSKMATARNKKKKEVN